MWHPSKFLPRIDYSNRVIHLSKKYSTARLNDVEPGIVLRAPTGHGIDLGIMREHGLIFDFFIVVVVAFELNDETKFKRHAALTLKLEQRLIN